MCAEQDIEVRTFTASNKTTNKSQQKSVSSNEEMDERYFDEAHEIMKLMEPFFENLVDEISSTTSLPILKLRLSFFRISMDLFSTLASKIAKYKFTKPEKYPLFGTREEKIKEEKRIKQFNFTVEFFEFLKTKLKDFVVKNLKSNR